MTLATDLRQLWSTSADPPDLLSRFDGGTPVQADQEARFPDLAGLWCQLVEWPEPMDSEVLTSGIVQRFRELRSEGSRLPRIEFSLAGLPTALRPAAFQMMLDEEFSGLRDRGLPIDVESWLHRFPRYASRIEEVVSGLSDELRNDRTCVTQAESILQRTQPVRLSPEADQTAMVIPTAAMIADDPIPDLKECSEGGAAVACCWEQNLRPGLPLP